MTTKAQNGGGTLYRLARKQVVHGTIDEVFGFFKDPKNLEALTPPWLNFEVRSYSTPRVRLGTEIQYRLRWKLFPMTWRSRISEYEDNALFADEMLRGPYKRWYHRHLFRETAGGVEVTDIVEYALPFGPLGTFVHTGIVRDQLEAIFEYRARAIATIFPSTTAKA